MCTCKDIRWPRVLALAVAGILVAGSASAIGTHSLERVRYQLEGGPESTFGYSSHLHDADDDTPMTGDLVALLSGSLTFDYDRNADLYTLTKSTVSTYDTTIDFWIISAELSGDGGGWLLYELAGTADYVGRALIVFEGGAGGPNVINDQGLRLWGAANVGEGDGRIGLDLAGSPVPEPGAALLFFVGGLVLSRGVPRRLQGVGLS
jgi:hypothetical protein